MVTEQEARKDLLNVSMHDDQPFVDAWRTMEAKGYMYGEDVLENVHLGWQLALANRPQPVEVPADLAGLPLADRLRAYVKQVHPTAHLCACGDIEAAADALAGASLSRTDPVSVDEGGAR